MDYLDQQAEKVRKRLRESEVKIETREKLFEEDIAKVRKIHQVTESIGFKFLYVAIDEVDCRIISAVFHLDLAHPETKSAIDPKTPSATLASKLKALGYGIIKSPGDKGVSFNNEDVTITLKKVNGKLECKMTIDF